jgi:hypothetical protein
MPAARQRGSAYCDDGRVSSSISQLDRSNVARGDGECRAGPPQRVLQQVEAVSISLAQATGLTREVLTLGSPVVPMVAMLAMLRTIDVRDDRVVIQIDSDGSDATRTIYLDLAEHPANVEPSLFGHSIGRWEGDTLMIDTVAFTPHRIGIGFGVPSGSGKHLIERLTLTADRLHLRYELTVEDPEYLTAPATHTAMWDRRPDLTPGPSCDPENSERFREE